MAALSHQHNEICDQDEAHSPHKDGFLELQFKKRKQ